MHIYYICEYDILVEAEWGTENGFWVHYDYKELLHVVYVGEL